MVGAELVIADTFGLTLVFCTGPTFLGEPVGSSVGSGARSSWLGALALEGAVCASCLSVPLTP